MQTQIDISSQAIATRIHAERVMKHNLNEWNKRKQEREKIKRDQEFPIRFYRVEERAHWKVNQ